MQARLLIESDSPNPDYKPPDPRGGPNALVEFQLYKARVPHSIKLPPGTVVSGHDAYQLCLMDGSGDGSRGIPGVILAEPADDECQLMVDYSVSIMSPLQKRMYDIAKSRAEIISKKLAADREAAEKSATNEVPSE